VVGDATESMSEGNLVNAVRRIMAMNPRPCNFFYLANWPTVISGMDAHTVTSTN
jgi:hypothetical protein